MNGLLGFIGMTVGGWLGWALGVQMSMFAAFLLSMVGTGVGLFAARRFVHRLFG